MEKRNRENILPSLYIPTQKYSLKLGKRQECPLGLLLLNIIPVNTVRKEKEIMYIMLGQERDKTVNIVDDIIHPERNKLLEQTVNFGKDAGCVNL